MRASSPKLAKKSKRMERKRGQKPWFPHVSWQNNKKKISESPSSSFSFLGLLPRSNWFLLTWGFDFYIFFWYTFSLEKVNIKCDIFAVWVNPIWIFLISVISANALRISLLADLFLRRKTPENNEKRGVFAPWNSLNQSMIKAAERGWLSVLRDIDCDSHG